MVVEPVDPLALKGKAELVGAFRLLDVRRGAAGHERRMDSPMVGRERPMRMLRDGRDEAASAIALQQKADVVIGNPPWLSY